MFQRGLTLIELMVVSAIVAILAGIGVPSFAQLIADTSLSSQVNGFMADARFARSEAMKRGMSVTMCASTNSGNADPSCSPTPQWNEGWIIFLDTDGDNIRDLAEQVLRRQEALPSSRSIAEQTTGVATRRLRFNSEGRIVGGAANIVFESSSSSSRVLPRKLCIAATGRVRLADSGTAPCTT